jgi:peroxiredoxin (alkyl hydroperoxide reductase subunit C)
MNARFRPLHLFRFGGGMFLLLGFTLGAWAEFTPQPMDRNAPPRDSSWKIAVGDPAPDFSLPAIDGSTFVLSEAWARGPVVLSFVPAAWTPVCSSQWKGYDLLADEFAAFDAQVVGITVDNLPTLRAWTEAMDDIHFPVVSDFYPHGAVASRYGVLRGDGTMDRALVVIDAQGIVRALHVSDLDVRPPLEWIIGALETIEVPRPETP